MLKFSSISRIIDSTRSATTIVLAIAQVVAPEVARLTGRGRSETERARQTEGPVTPATGAFVIWAPIFLSSLTYAVRSSSRERRSDPLLRRIGWLTSAAYAGNVAWSLNAQFRGLDWSSVVLITVSGLSATTALIAAEQASEAQEARFVATSVAPLAGWLTVASFANIEAALNQEQGRPTPNEESRRAIKLIGAATGIAAATTVASRGNPLFALAAGWGLGGVVVKNVRSDWRVAAAAGLGLAALVGVTALARRTR